MGEKGNLDPATVTDAAGGRSVTSTVVDIAADKGDTLADAVIAESAGAGIGVATARLTEKDEEEAAGEAEGTDAAGS